MTFANWVLVGVGLFAILGAIGEFTIAFRRTRAEGPDPSAGLSDETRRADRSLVGVRVAPIAVAEQEQAPVEEPVEEVVVEEVAKEPEPAAGVAVVETQRIVEVTPEESGVSRRQFFNRAITTTFAAFLGFQGLGYLALFWPKLTGGFGSDVDAGAVEDLVAGTQNADGTIGPVFIPEARAYVVPAPKTLSEQFEGKQVVAGGLFALYQRCVHLGCRVPWCASSIGFECPCHGSKYNSVGEYFAGPAPRNLDRFVVEIRNGDRFIIRTGTIIQTPRAPVKSVKYPQGPSCV
ncbi:MAG TPA: ubiquinol-cytochrome c reductase iron-sulfur subunit [Acidimicrobiia bacterium]|nr:ubiquinol-cytochrome c reductase iron-sulfur subunit [Acidimicrobiia bacterium]